MSRWLRRPQHGEAWGGFDRFRAAGRYGWFDIHKVPDGLIIPGPVTEQEFVTVSLYRAAVITFV